MLLHPLLLWVFYWSLEPVYIYWLYMVYSCLPFVCYYTHFSHGCLITGVWNLSTSTDYICCIVVSLCMLLHPLLPWVFNYWSLEPVYIYWLYMLYSCLPCVCYYTHHSYGCLITGVWNLSILTASQRLVVILVQSHNRIDLIQSLVPTVNTLCM